MYHRRLLLTLHLHSHALRTTVIPTLNSRKVEFTEELRNFLIRDSNLDIFLRAKKVRVWTIK